MTALMQIAVTFCRECLGWDVRKATKKGVYAVDGSLLIFRDLNAVIQAVRGWCDKHGGIAIICFGKDEQFSASVEVWDVDAYGEIEHDDPCHALLEACVEAQRELSEIQELADQ